MPESAVKLQDKRIVESSGLTRDAAQTGVFWTLNDSGNSAELYAIDEQGSTVRSVTLDGIENVDWESMTRIPEGLVVGDIGNNFGRRDDLALHIVAPGEGTRAEHVRTVRFDYPDRGPAGMSVVHDWDAEALFYDAPNLYLLSKHRSDTNTTLYKVPMTGEAVVLEELAKFDVGGDPRKYGGRVTGADLRADGQFLAVLCYHAIWIFRRGEHWLAEPVRTIEIDQRVVKQAEAIAWSGKDLLFTTEAGWLHRIEDPMGSEVSRYPAR